MTRRDLDWYRTQFGTGVGNCGPALVSMAILWARGIDVGVQNICREIGYPRPDGGLSLEDLQRPLTRHGVSIRSAILESDDDGGHYILVKGYSLDRRYFVVYDPYPADWEKNSLRYEDGVTMIGKNRYYRSTQLMAALKTRKSIEVCRN